MTDSPHIAVSREWAIFLKDAGWPQDSCTAHFVWVYDDDYTDTWTLMHVADPDRPPMDESDMLAPTAEEVLRMLPTNDRLDAVEAWIKGRYGTLADAAAAMFCYRRSST